MEGREVITLDHLGSVELDQRLLTVYDREIGIRLLYEDPASGAEHYLVRYPAGLQALPHRHTAAQTIVVLEGRLAVNDEVIGPGAYCHFLPGEPMFHAPAADGGCLFVTIFHGPFDVEPVGEEGMRPGPRDPHSAEHGSGGGRESNPPGALRPPTGFEDRGAHQALVRLRRAG